MIGVELVELGRDLLIDAGLGLLEIALLLGLRARPCEMKPSWLVSAPLKWPSTVLMKSARVIGLGAFCGGARRCRAQCRGRQEWGVGSRSISAGKLPGNLGRCRRAASDKCRASGQTAARMTRNLTHLDRLEAESIFILRETVAEAARPVMLYSMGKDSAVMLHLARKGLLSRGRCPSRCSTSTRPGSFGTCTRCASKRRGRARHRAHRLQEPRGARQRHQPVRPWAAAHRHVEDRRAEAGAGQVRLRRGVRRRPPRRGEEPRQGARVQLPRQEPPLGPEAAAARAVVAVQCPQEQGRDDAGVPAVQLDRARRLAIHPARGRSRSCRSTSPPSGRRWSATA